MGADEHAAFTERENLLSTAIGKTVVAAAGLEKSLLGLLLLSRGGTDSFTPKEVEELETLTAGMLLGRLRQTRMDEALADRAHALIDQRNKLVHGFFEETDVARAMVRGDGFDEVREGVERLGAECRALAHELQEPQARAVEEGFGMSLSELADATMKAEPSHVCDPVGRETLEMLQTMIGLTGWPNSPLYDSPSPPPAD